MCNPDASSIMNDVTRFSVDFPWYDATFDPSDCTLTNGIMKASWRSMTAEGELTTRRKSSRSSAFVKMKVLYMD